MNIIKEKNKLKFNYENMINFKKWLDLHFKDYKKLINHIKEKAYILKTN